MRIELHDIHLGNLQECDRILEILNYLGAYRSDLMIIPSPQDVDGSPEVLIKWTEKKLLQGHKLYCHGFHHIIDKTTPRSILGLIQGKFTNNEAELAGLDEGTTRALLRKAKDFWDHFFHQPSHGFVAPTWHASSHLPHIAREVGFQSVGTRFFWYEVGKKRQFSIPLSLFSQNLSTMKRSIYWARLIQRLLNTHCRLVLHPADFDSPEKEVLIMDFIRSLPLKNTAPEEVDYVI